MSIQRIELPDYFKYNQLYLVTDNLELMKSPLLISSESIDLIYCDPPFYSQKNYTTKSKIDDIIRSFTDTFTDLTEYLHFLHVRLIEMKKLLKPNGSIYIHLDWHSSHYVKVMTDNIFGYDNFINNIVWCYTGGASSRDAFATKHDDILSYAMKRGDHTFNYNEVSVPYKPGTEVLIDEKTGKKYYLKSGIRYYIERNGKILEDWWCDIQNMNHNPLNERHDYPTEKPQPLLERIIKVSSNPGDTVADFFGGSGTTAAAAQKLGRKWIICDKSEDSVNLIKARLLGNTSIKEKSYQLPIDNF